MILDNSALEKAIQRLQEGLIRYEQNPQDLQIRDGLIQRFEFTYEQSHKMLKRYLKLTSSTPEAIEILPFADLIRLGHKQGLLLNNWSSWKNYREMRAKTSHTYDEEVAMTVVEQIPNFLQEAIYLSMQLKKR